MIKLKYTKVMQVLIQVLWFDLISKIQHKLNQMNQFKKKIIQTNKKEWIWFNFLFFLGVSNFLF